MDSGHFQLPNETLEHIFHELWSIYLSDNNDQVDVTLQHFRLVSHVQKRWRGVAERIIWRNLFIGSYQHLVKVQNLLEEQPELGNLIKQVHFRLRERVEGLENVVHEFLGNLSNVRTVDIDGNRLRLPILNLNRMTSVALRSFTRDRGNSIQVLPDFSTLHMLKKLHLQQVHCHQVLPLHQCPRLTNLTLDYANNSLMPNFTVPLTLQSLALRTEESFYPNASFKFAEVPVYPHLQFLVFHCRTFLQSASLPSMPSLKLLKISFGQSSHNLFFQFIPTLFVQSNFLTDLSLYNVRMKDTPNNPTFRLKALALVQCTIDVNTSIEFFQTCANNLIALKFSEIMDSSSEDMIPTSQIFDLFDKLLSPNLAYLEFPGPRIFRSKVHDPKRYSFDLSKCTCLKFFRSNLLEGILDHQDFSQTFPTSLQFISIQTSSNIIIENFEKAIIDGHFPELLAVDLAKSSKYLEEHTWTATQKQNVKVLLGREDWKMWKRRMLNLLKVDKRWD